MSLEGQLLDRKSLRAVTGKTADWAELAKDCVAFANGLGGRLLIGIEDGQAEPPPDQRLPVGLADTLRRRIAERTLNVSLRLTEQVAANGGQWLELAIDRASAVASTSDGRYFLRVGDASRPVLGDEVLRLATERQALPWETLTTLAVPRDQVDATQQAALLVGLRQLELRDAEQLRPWLGRLGDWGLVKQAGRTQATRYFVAPDLLRRLEFPAMTTLKRLEDHRLRALVQEDLARYPGSAIGDIHQRIGVEIPLRRLRTTLAKLVEQAVLHKAGERRGTRYTLVRSPDLLTKGPSNPANDGANAVSIPQGKIAK